jgi:hypothetical protein
LRNTFQAMNRNRITVDRRILASFAIANFEVPEGADTPSPVRNAVK